MDRVTYRQTVGEVAAGDVVVHYRLPYLVAFSRAEENARHYVKLPRVSGKDYGSGWRFRTEYLDLQSPVHKDRFASDLVGLIRSHYPVDRNGNIRQGYFFPFDREGMRVVLRCVEEPLPEWLCAFAAEKERPIAEEVSFPEEYHEGALRRIAVNAYERDPKARGACIEHYGPTCVVCELSFGDEYGEAAAGLIHVHHLIPLSQIGEDYVVDPIAHLRPICPNCHAVIHLKQPPLEVEEVRGMLGKPNRRMQRTRRKGARR